MKKEMGLWGLVAAAFLLVGCGPLGLVRPGHKVNSGYEHRTFFFD